MVAGSCLNVLSNLFWLESKTEHAGRIPFRLTPEHASDLLKGLEFGQLGEETVSSPEKFCHWFGPIPAALNIHEAPLWRPVQLQLIQV